MTASTAEGSVWVIVAAAGESRRMGLPDGESKQFLLLGGEPILSHSVRRLLEMPEVGGLVVVLHPSHTVRFAKRAPLLRREQAAAHRRGRAAALRLGPRGLARGPGRGRVHRRPRRRPAALLAPRLRALPDGARATPTAPSPAWRSATRSSAPAPAASSRRPSTGTACGPCRRRRSSAPAPLREVYGRTDLDGATDDAALLERAGYKVAVVPSTPANVKITTPADLPLAGALLSWEAEADV